VGSGVEYMKIKADNNEMLKVLETEYIKICSHGGMQATIRAMDFHPYSRDVFCNGCQFLMLAARAEENRRLAGTSGAILTVTSGMARLGGDVEPLVCGCNALCNLIYCLPELTSSRETVTSAAFGDYCGLATLEAVLAAMRRQAGAESVQVAACNVLRNLVYYEDLHAAAAGAGAVELVVEAMRRHRSAARVQAAACIAVKTLACGAVGAGLLWRIREAGGAEAAREALATHRADPAVRAEALDALRVLLR
jgi:hypothetical protein